MPINNLPLPPPPTVHAPFYLYISISLQILVLFKLHQLFNFSSPSGGSGGFRVAEQEKAEAFRGGFEIHGGLGCVPLTWAFWLPQTTGLIKTHTRHFSLVWGESLLLRSTETVGRGNAFAAQWYSFGDHLLSPCCKSSHHLWSTYCVQDAT